MDWKKIGKKFLFPPLWLMVLLTVASAALLILVFVKGWEETAVAYMVYVLSFYTLSVVTAFCVMVLPKQYRRIRQSVLDHPLGNRFVTDKVFRTKVTLYTSLTVNLLYVGTNVLSWYLYKSWWFVCLAVYYTILSVMRFLLARYVRTNEIGAQPVRELRRSLACSYIMLLLNLFLSGAVLMVVYQDKGYEYDGVLIYVMAAYTFYITVNAIVNLIKYRRLGSPVVTTTKIISLVSALVSMLNLETAMFAQFGGDMAEADQRLMIMLTGAGISIVVITLAVLSILRCTIEIRKIRSGCHGES